MILHNQYGFKLSHVSPIYSNVNDAYIAAHTTRTSNETPPRAVFEEAYLDRREIENKRLWKYLHDIFPKPPFSLDVCLCAWNGMKKQLFFIPRGVSFCVATRYCSHRVNYDTAATAETPWGQIDVGNSMERQKHGLDNRPDIPEKPLNTGLEERRFRLYEYAYGFRRNGTNLEARKVSG